MTLGVSLFLIAVGAILAFAVRTAVEGIDIVVVGAVGLLLSLLFWASFAPFGTHEHGHDRVGHHEV